MHLTVMLLLTENCEKCFIVFYGCGILWSTEISFCRDNGCLCFFYVISEHQYKTVNLQKSLRSFVSEELLKKGLQLLF